MKIPSVAASIKYSGQCAQSASHAAFGLAAVTQIVCTLVQDAPRCDYSVEYFAALDGCSDSMTRLNALIDTNIRWLWQALDLLSRLDDTAYATMPPGFEPHRAGGHLRHVVEFYQAFLDGLGSSRIDYDARRRDPNVEQSRAAAAAAIDRIVEGLGRNRDALSERTVWVRMEDAAADLDCDPFMKSSVSRELQVLSSHTIHHFALIALTLRLHGVDVDPNFGMAPSTLRHLAETAKAA